MVKGIISFKKLLIHVFYNGYLPVKLCFGTIFLLWSNFYLLYIDAKMYSVSKCTSLVQISLDASNCNVLELYD
jgi:hypothetical protein